MLTDKKSIKEFLVAQGVHDDKVQEKLAATMGCRDRSIVGELTFALIACRPDVSFTTVKCAQANACPAEIHYRVAQHCLRFLYGTRDRGIYYWRSNPRHDLPKGQIPEPFSAPGDLLPKGRPQLAGTEVGTYTDSDYGNNPLTRQSCTGICLCMAGGVIAYKTKIQKTVALLSCEAEFMAACDAGKMVLYVCSIFFDLDIPQLAVSLIFEDNDATTLLANAQKLSTRMRHMDIRWFALCDWVERDLVILQRVSTSLNLADHFTKCLDRILFYRHTDYIMGRVTPPHSYGTYFAHCTLT